MEEKEAAILDFARWLTEDDPHCYFTTAKLYKPNLYRVTFVSDRYRDYADVADAIRTNFHCRVWLAHINADSYTLQYVLDKKQEINRGEVSLRTKH
ncbi:hypothetical protein FACS1894217_08210 [Clostridia bacterium]|nr:hypothetical protein FACS1894217_08210 [Clostridia bacterium]